MFSVKKITAFYISILLFPLLSAVACASPVDEYSRAWAGWLDGEPGYFVPREIIPGDFLSWPGEELFIIDDDGYGHVVEWEENRLVTRVVTGTPVSGAGVRGATAFTLRSGGQQGLAVLDERGKLSVVGAERDEFEVLCTGCLPPELEGYSIIAITSANFDTDSRDEVLLWARGNGTSLVIVVEWGVTGFTSQAAREIYAEKVPGAAAALYPAYEGEMVGRYHVVSESGAGQELAGMEISEDGAYLEKYGAPPEWLGGIRIISSGAPGDAREPLLFAIDSFESGVELLLIMPGENWTVSRYPSVPPRSIFALSADLNGDGTEELLFSDHECRFEVHARSAAMTVKVDGREIEPGRAVRQLSGGRVFVDATLFPGAEVALEENHAVVKGHDGRELILDYEKNVMLLKVPDSEENKVLDEGFIVLPGAVMISPRAAGQAGFDCRWDWLSKTLETGGGERG